MEVLKSKIKKEINNVKKEYEAWAAKNQAYENTNDMIPCVIVNQVSPHKYYVGWRWTKNGTKVGDIQTDTHSTQYPEMEIVWVAESPVSQKSFELAVNGLGLLSDQLERVYEYISDDTGLSGNELENTVRCGIVEVYYNRISPDSLFEFDELRLSMASVEDAIQWHSKIKDDFSLLAWGVKKALTISGCLDKWQNVANEQNKSLKSLIIGACLKSYIGYKKAKKEGEYIAELGEYIALRLCRIDDFLAIGVRDLTNTNKGTGNE